MHSYGQCFSFCCVQQHVIKAYWLLEVQLYSLLTLALEPEERSSAHLREGWAGFTFGLNTLIKIQIPQTGVVW